MVNNWTSPVSPGTMSCNIFHDSNWGILIYCQQLVYTYLKQCDILNKTNKTWCKMQKFKTVTYIHRSRYAVRTGCIYPQEIIPVLISVRGRVDPRAVVWSQGFMSMKNSMTPSGFEPATFWFVAQYLNHCATAVPCVMSTQAYKRSEQ
jgi:hypothetical protein